MQAAQVLDVDVRMVMLADVFKDRLSQCRKSLDKRGVNVPDKHCHLGFDAYKKVMDSDVDLVILATPPNFRPVHLEAAVEQDKHVFMEKPAAVDPVGCRRVMAAGRRADAKGLTVVAGTQRRHERNYLAAARAVSEGAIGKVVGGTIHFCLGGGSIGFKPADVPDWEWMVRRWGGWSEMSGDHIVEQHVHSVDVMNWFLGAHPVSCVSFGERARRTGGDMYDFFSTDYEFPDEVHIHSMCRQIPRCWNRIGQLFRGERGVADITGLVSADDYYVGGLDRKSPIELPEIKGHESPYVQEHVDLLRSILRQEPINEAQNVANATLAAVMGRISAYTGRKITWNELMESDLECKPTPADFESEQVTMPAERAPVAGEISA